MSRAGDPNYWREKAEKALRLARSIPDEDVAQRLNVLAADYLERAQALAGEVQARPEAVQQELQQHQQPPDPGAKKDG